MGFCWTTLQVSDLDRAIAFYRDVAGLPVARRFGGGGHFIAFLGDGETKVELIADAGRTPPGRGEGATLGFRVASLDAQLALCAEKGVAVERGPMSPGPGIRFFYVRDPDGFEVQFVEESR